MVFTVTPGRLGETFIVAPPSLPPDLGEVGAAARRSKTDSHACVGRVSWLLAAFPARWRVRLEFYVPRRVTNVPCTLS